MKRILATVLLIIAASKLRADPLPRTLLVFPFENRSSRPDLNWISESFAETLSTRLAGAERFVLGRGERDAALEQLGIPAGTPVTLATTYKVAEILGVDWTVTGDFTVEGNRLTARAQLLDLRRLKLATPLEASGELADLAELQTRLAWRLLATEDGSFTVGTEEDFARRFQPIRLDAYENLIRGILATDKPARVHFLSEADRLNPADHRAALELGRFYFGEKDYENSALWLHKLDGKDANYLESQFLLGVDEFFLGHDALAERTFEGLSLQIPLNEVWNNLGLVQARAGRLGAATASFQRAYDGDPTDATFCFNLGVCLLGSRNYPEAARHLSEALQLSADDPEVHALLADALAAAGDVNGRDREEKWLALHGGNEAQESGRDLMTHLRLKKQYDGRAYRLLALAVSSALEDRLQSETPERHAAAHMARGQQFFDAGRLVEAERELAEAVWLLPQASDAHLALARVYEAEGRHREAAAELETSIKISNTAPAQLLLARVCLALGQPQAARDHSQAALSLDPNNHEAQALINQIAGVAPAERKTP
ncbi:MAG: tetratricopeptide repeat protein [Acidobacteriia bacterium]|nr:tetratricopeptide repeat protein [Terriglobia bacterium]